MPPYLHDRHPLRDLLRPSNQLHPQPQLSHPPQELVDIMAPLAAEGVKLRVDLAASRDSNLVP